MKKKGKIILLILAIAAAGILPMLLYGIFIGSVPTITPGEAVELLNKPDSDTVLVDTRTAEEVRDNRLYNAQNWPYKSIMTLSSLDEVPEQFNDKHLLLLCKSGITSALAVRKLQKLGLTKVTNIRGGAQAWVAEVQELYAPEFYRIIKDSGETKHYTRRKLSLFKQWLLIFYSFGIKPLYMLLSLLIIIILWRVRSLDLKTLKWGLIFFLTGEAACYVDSLIYHGWSYLFEYIHIFGMVIAFGFVTFAILEGVDRRIVKYSDPEQKCAAIDLCRTCFKYTDAPCGLKRLFLFITLACMAVAFIPITGVPHWIAYKTHILGTPINHSHPVIIQLFEIRFCPYFALALFFITFLILLFKKEDPVSPAKVFFSGGTGYLSFGILRFFLSATYRDNPIWKAFWEEATELIFVAAVGITLWLFRHKLFKKEKTIKSA